MIKVNYFTKEGADTDYTAFDGKLFSFRSVTGDMSDVVKQNWMEAAAMATAAGDLAPLGVEEEANADDLSEFNIYSIHVDPEKLLLVKAMVDRQRLKESGND